MRDVTFKLQNTKAKKKVLENDLFAQDLMQMSKAHHTFLSFYLFRSRSESTEFKDPKIKPLLILLAKIFALK